MSKMHKTCHNNCNFLHQPLPKWEGGHAVSHKVQECLAHRLMADRLWEGHKAPAASPEAASLGAAAYQALCEE